VVNEGKIYVTNSGTGEVYDPSRERWTTFAAIPNGVVDISISVVGGRIYSFGGFDSGMTVPGSSVFIYDPTSDTWAQLTDMPFKGWVFTASEVDGKFYIFGGIDQEYHDGIRDPQPKSNVWEVTIDS
jgi:N-acetylneuraminic acid mutarotase